MRRAVSGYARGEEVFHLHPFGGERTAAIAGNARDQLFEGDVEPHRHAVHVDGGPVFRVHERAAAGGDDDVAKGEQQAQDVAFGGSKIGLAVLREDIGDRATLARLDQFVDVLGPPLQSCREGSCDGTFPSRHEAHQIDFVHLCNRRGLWLVTG